MKKVLLSLFTLLLISQVSFAQDASKLIKSAKKALDAYQLTPDKKEKLKEAQEIISGLAGNAEAEGMNKYWKTRGDIFNEVATLEVTMEQLNGSMKLDNPGASLEAYTSFNKYLGLAEKKYEKKEALKGLLESAVNLSNVGEISFRAKDFASAYDNFNAVIEADKIFKANDSKSTMQTDEQRYNIMYAAGVSALYAEKMTEAAPIFQGLYDAKYDKPEIYDALYKIKSATNDPDAATILEEGRAKYPDDVSLLYAEINLYLKENKLDVLTGKLKSAIDKDPENVSLYSTLGSVYDNLSTKSFEAGDKVKGEEYFTEALSYFDQVLAKDDKNFDAMYSVGALWYNKAASMTKELVTLESDYSKDGMRKYETKKAEVFELFDKALPHFLKADGLNPKDRNTLIALKEIYAKKDDLPKSTEYKKRLEELGN